MPTNTQFRIDLPDSWQETTVYTFQGPHDSGVQHNLVLVIQHDMPKKADLIQWAKQQFGTHKETLPGYEFINEKEKIMPDGTPAYEIVYKYSPTDQFTFFQKQVFVIKEDKGFIFTSTFSKKTLETIAIDVDKIINTLRMIEPEDWE
jgi:hypothetical protein